MPDTPVAESNDNPNSKAIEIDDELVNKLTIKISDMLCTDLKGDKTIELFMAIIKTAQGQKVAADLKKKQNDELKYTAKLVGGGENVFEKILASIYPNDTPQELARLRRENGELRAGLANDQLGGVTGPYSPYILYHYLRIIGELLEEKKKAEAAKKAAEPKPVDAAAKLQRFQRGVAKRTKAKEAASKAKDKVTTVKDAIETTIDGDNTLNTNTSEDNDNKFITKNHLDNVAKYINLLNVVSARATSLATTGEPDVNIISYLNSLADINLIDGEGKFTSAPISKDFLSSTTTDADGNTVDSPLPEGVLTNTLLRGLRDELDTTKFGKVKKEFVENITDTYKFVSTARGTISPRGRDRVKDVFNIMLYTDDVISELIKNKQVQDAINEVAKQSAVRGKGGEAVAALRALGEKPDEVTIPDTIDGLKEELSKFGLETTGDLPDLEARLRGHLDRDARAVAVGGGRKRKTRSRKTRSRSRRR